MPKIAKWAAWTNWNAETGKANGNSENAPMLVITRPTQASLTNIKPRNLAMVGRPCLTEIGNLIWSLTGKDIVKRTIGVTMEDDYPRIHATNAHLGRMPVEVQDITIDWAF